MAPNRGPHAPPVAATVPQIDQYSPLTHKLPLRDNRSLAPVWVDPKNARRLDAYRILAAYRANVARHFLPPEGNPDDRREYGDAELLVSRVAAGVLGDELQLIVDGADTDLPDEPDLPPRPDPLPGDADPLTRRIHTIREARWTATATGIVDQWEAAWQTQPALQERQRWLRQWADDEFLHGKMVEAEHDAAGLGDAVYVLQWSPTTGRPVLDVCDPGFYFPVVTDNDRGYPSKVHLAWEFEETAPDGTVTRFVRRLTYELVTLNYALFDPELGDFPRDDTGALALPDGDTVNADGHIVRRYPWQADDDEASTITCVFTDATWPLEKAKAFNPDDARYAFTDDGQVAHNLDLRIDFIPVVHIPNTPATREHFGRSILDVVAQVLDDLAQSDTDIQAASALCAGPTVALIGGGAGEEQTVQPGVVWNVPADGDMKALDLAVGLEKLLAAGDRILDRLNVNSRVPAEVLGRVSVSEVPSGVALSLAFGPFRQLIDHLRLTRGPKYQLLLKFVQRLAQAGGALEPGVPPSAHVAFGAYLPSDVKAAADLVVALLGRHGISRRTALRMLVDAGVDIGDLVDELARIDAEDTEAAVHVADATGSEELAAERLGLVLPEPAPAAGPPQLNLPPTGGA